jgi:hypothetical protein
MSTISTTLIAASEESGRVRIDTTLFPQSCYLGAHLQLGQGFAGGCARYRRELAARLPYHKMSDSIRTAAGNTTSFQVGFV